MPRRPADPTASSKPMTPRVLTLDQLEQAIIEGTGRAPSDVACMRATTRAMLALSGPPSAFATVRCEPRSDGRLRITGGSDAIVVARALRARADWRGDHVWASLLGRRLLFRVEAGTPTPARSGARRGLLRLLLRSTPA